MDERRRGWVLLLLRLELPLARAQCPRCVWSFTARYSLHMVIFWWWVVGLVPPPFPQSLAGSEALRGAMSPPRAAAGQDSNEVLVLSLAHPPTTTHKHRQAGQQDKEEDQEASTLQLLSNQPSLHSCPGSASLCYVCILPCDSPTATHPYTPPTQDVNNAVAKRSDSELPARVGGGVCAVHASSSCGKLRLEGGRGEGREGYRMGWLLLRRIAAGAAAGGR